MRRAMPSDLGVFYQMFNRDFGGYNEEIRRVVEQAFDNSPRTASSVRDILTPRSPDSLFGLQHPPDTRRSSRRTRSSLPDLTSSAPEVSFSDLNFAPTPRSSVTELPPYTPRTPKSSRYKKTLDRIPEKAGSDLSRKELSRHRLNERPLPLPKTPPAGRNENGVHIPYLDLPATSRSNTLVNMNDFLSTLLSGYGSSQGATTLQTTLPPASDQQPVVPPPEKGWTKRDKMFLAGLIFIGIIVLLLAIVVILLVIGVVNDKDDSDSSSQSSLTKGPAYIANTVTPIPSTAVPNITNSNNETLFPDGMSSTWSPKSSSITKLTTKKPVPPSTTVINILKASTSTTTLKPSTKPTTTTRTTTTTTTKTLMLATTSKPAPTTASTKLTTTSSTTTKDSGSNGIIILETKAPEPIVTTRSPSTTRPTDPPIILLPGSDVDPAPVPPNIPSSSSTTALPGTTKPVAILSTKSTTPTTTTTTSSTNPTTTASSTTTKTPSTTGTTPTTSTSTATTTRSTTTTTSPAVTHPLAPFTETECNTEKCQQLSDVIQSSINVSSSECDNFYSYACEGRQPSQQRPRSMSEITPLYDMVSQDLYDMAIDTLANLDTETESDNERVAGTIYMACLASNTGENQNAVYRELGTLLENLHPSSTMTFDLSFDLFLRRAQDKTGVTPFYNIRRIPLFDGSSYTYMTRVAPPSLTFPLETYSEALENSSAGQTYIDVITTLIQNILEINNRGRKKRDVNEANGPVHTSSSTSQMNRKRRQAVDNEVIRQSVALAFEFEWRIANLFAPSTNWQDQLAVTQTVRTLQAQVPEIPWVLLTELSIIDDIQVMQKPFFISLNDLVGRTREDIVKMYIYVKALISVFPYLPATFRRTLADTNTGIQQTYTTSECSRLTFHVAFEETLSLVLGDNADLISVEKDYALTMSNSAKGDIMRIMGDYEGINRTVKLDILSDLSSLTFKEKLINVPQSIDHSARSLPIAPVSLLKVATAIQAHTNAYRLTIITESRIVNESITTSFIEFEPMVNAKNRWASLPIGFIHLGSWMQNAEFLMNFYKTLVHRSLLDYIFRKYIYSAAFVNLNDCTLKQFGALDSVEGLQNGGKDVQIAALTEAATQGLLYRDSEVSTRVAVKLGTNYFYERQFSTLAYAQPFCIDKGVNEMLSWPESVKPNVLLQRTIRRDYRSSVTFGCTSSSCFFWAQRLNSGGGGEGGEGGGGFQ